jgi:adenylate kinase
MRPRILFVAGVHGTGKTSLCRSISTKFDVAHCSASELIAQYRGIHFRPDRRVDDISQNQDALIAAIAAILGLPYPH